MPIEKEGSSQVNNTGCHLKKPGKEEKTELKASRRKNIIKINA